MTPSRIIKIVIVCGMVVCSGGIVYAIQPYVPLAPIPEVTNAQPNLVAYLNALFRLTIGVAAFIAVIRLGIAGVKYMGESVAGKGEAKGDIKEIIGGLLLILAIVLILATVNKNILNLDILKGVPRVGPVDLPTSPTSGNTSGLNRHEQGAVMAAARRECMLEGGTPIHSTTTWSGVQYSCDKSGAAAGGAGAQPY